MKRDIQINYGILDQIIEQLHTYKNALNQMHSSLTSIAVYVESNAGKSLDVWDDTIQQSKKNITSYQAQIDDLLSLFENYVTDTTAYITPISRNSMMRVDRNDIWWNLTQIESGVNNNMFHAILETHKSPSFLFGLFDDPTPEEKERSRHNKQKLDAIRTNIESSKAMLEKNIEGLWDLYETKVKKFENVDDEYSNKAAAVKDTYTNFFEGVSDVVSVTVEGVWNFIKGVGVAVYEIAEGLISLVIDAGIIAISNNIPDFIEPEFLKKAATTRVETFAGTLEQIIDDPIIVLESVAQSISDTSEKEGIMYVTGGAATSLIPYVGQSKYLKLLKVDKDRAPNTKAVNPAISQKVKEIVQNNKVFEGIKKETVELYKDIKNGGTRFVDDVTDFLGRTLFPNQSLQMSTANSVPVNVFSRSTVEDRIDSVVSRSSVKVEEKGTGDGTKGTGNRLAGESDVKTLVGRGEQYTNGRKNRLKPNIRYQTGEYDYFYETDGAGRLVKFETENLQLTTRTDRLSHSKNTPGKVKGQDHAGHLAGDRFGGSPKIDNLVSQLSDVNLKEYKKIEDTWAAALKETPPKEVTVDVEIVYDGNNMRPEKFIVNYAIDGKSEFQVIKN
ncbi:DNA/RNA non-specific endonuclease [Bacillus weihaiensis]|uniref:DNA/RNA non-specific endonuclease n=1 Tax=Bacillus weihaiensis TaxID=1547283 RepID=UPI000AAF75A0|nr:DNA/RNA non-specific endonuclease [Bacillus weihaiensis]